MDILAGLESDTQDTEEQASHVKSELRRVKGKSKVWEKVTRFARRTRRDSLPEPEGANVPDDDAAALPQSADCMDYDLNPFHLSGQSPAWFESSSSSDGEATEAHLGMCVKKSRLYPNSEIVEQSCLRPSIAKALFQQMEAASSGSARPTKYGWQKKKRRTHHTARCADHVTGLMCEDVRSTVMPVDCTTSAVRSGQYATHSNIYTGDKPSSLVPEQFTRHTSSVSLDSVRTRHCTTGEKANSQQFSHLPCDSPDCDNQDCDSNRTCLSMKTASLPNYHSHSFHKKCEQCGLILRNLNLLNTSGIIDGMSDMFAACFCQCKQQILYEESPCQSNQSGHWSGLTTSSSFVRPVEFKSKFETMKEWFAEFSDEQKNLVLREFLTECDVPQIHLLSLELEPRLHHGCPPNCCDRFSWLPYNVSLQVLSFLDPVSLCRASSVCRSWHQLLLDQSLWRRLCSLTKWKLARSVEQKQFIQHMMPDGSIHWKKVFSERFRLRNNWLRGKCNVRTFEGHTQGISCVQFDDTRIVSGSSDKTIKVWNIRTNSPWSVQTLVGHSGTVRCLFLEGNRLVSGSSDTTIKVWDLSTQQSWSSIACKVTMTGHLDTVRCLQVDDEKVISGSYDKTLKLWDIRTGVCQMTLRSHTAAVLCLQFDNSKIVSGSCDKTIKVWTFAGDCVMTLTGHQDAVTCLQFDDTRIVSGSLDCTIKFWTIVTGSCVKTIDWKASEGHTGVVRCLQSDSWRVVSASDDKTLKVWSLETGKRLVTLRNHTDGVTCLQFNDSIIVSGSYDKTVKLWDFSCC